MRSKIIKNYQHILGYLLTLTLTLYHNVSISDLSWGFWLSGLCLCWMSVIIALIKTNILNEHSTEYLTIHKLLTKYIPKKYEYLTIKIIIFFLTISIGYACFYLYCYLFGFYGIFLSVFAEMSPLNLFGRNGFINSDFFTPVVYLLEKFWYLVIGTLISQIYYLSSFSPFKFIVNQFDREILKIHLIVLCLPFISFGSWMLLGNSYESLTIIIIFTIYFLLCNHKPPATHIPRHS